MPELLIGWSEIDTTPQGKVDLYGQYYHRVSGGVHLRLSATVLALESANGQQAVMISLDVCGIRSDFQDDLGDLLRPELPDLDVAMIFVNVTHTHNAPSVNPFPAIGWLCELPEVLQVTAYRQFLLQKIKVAVIKAWQNRKPGGLAHATGEARVGHCRQVVYADNTAEMYGKTDRQDFTAMESGEDSAVQMLFTFDKHSNPTGMILNLACPAQVMEATYQISSDFIGQTRRLLREHFGDDFYMLPQISAAGCQAPRDLTRNDHSELDFWHEQGVSKLGQSLKRAVVNVFDEAAAKIVFSPIFRHSVKAISLPRRRVSYPDFIHAQNELKKLEATVSQTQAYSQFCDEVHRNEKASNLPGPYDSKFHPFVLIQNNKAVIARYLDQNQNPEYEMQLHTLRLGRAVIATNPFELYLDFGHQIKARSAARQTLIIQLCTDMGGYLPTAQAQEHGGYGSLIINGEVGCDGGKKLVDLTVKQIKALWK